MFIQLILDTNIVYSQNNLYKCEEAYKEIYEYIANNLSEDTEWLEYNALKDQIEDTGDEDEKNALWCSSLASSLVDWRVGESYFNQQETNSFFEQNISPRDFQNTTAETSISGTPAQGNAVPSVEPLAVAGGTFSAAGTNQGAATIAALTLNPSIFYINPTDTEQTTKWGRFSDITVFFPVNALGGDNETLDYFGIRARINITGINSGKEFIAETRKSFNNNLRQAREAFTQLVTSEDALTNEVKSFLENSDNTEECALAILKNDQNPNLCNVKINFGTITDSRKVNELRTALNEARKIADTKYFGMDLRFDYGDPSLGAIEGASGIKLFGGVAFGRKLRDNVESILNLKGRVGVNYFDQENYVSTTSMMTNGIEVSDSTSISGKTNFSFDAAFGFELLRQINQLNVSISSGLESRYGDTPEGFSSEAFQTDYLMWRSSFSVPISSANHVTLNLGVPIVGEISPVFSVSANWSVLLPNLN